MIKRFQRDVATILWLSATIFLALSLMSYDPMDPSFNSLGHRIQAHNWCGYLGSFLSDLIFQVFGLGCVLLVVVSAIKTMRCIRLSIQDSQGKRGVSGGVSGSGSDRSSGSSSGSSEHGRATELIVWTMALVNLCSLLGLYFPEERLFQASIAVGGVLGMTTSQGLMLALNHTGVSILLWGWAALLLVLMTEKSLVEIANDLKSSLLLIWKGIRASSSIIWSLFFSETKQAHSRYEQQRQQAERKKSQSAPLQDSQVVGLVTKKSDIDKNNINKIDKENSRVDGSGDAEEIVVAPGTVARRRVRLEAKVNRNVENWKLPEISLLEDPPATRVRVDAKEIQKKSEILVDKLSQFGVRGEIGGAKPGPAVTLFEFKPAADVKISRITELADDLSLALSSESVRIIAPIPGRDVVGIETSNSSREHVYLKDVLAQETFWSDKLKLPVALGRQADGEPKIVDLRKMPHLMVAGTTGSGKSVFIVSAITGLLFRHSPKTLRLILIDPKQVDLAAFSGVPHLLMPPIREPRKAVTALKWAIREMDIRYRSMSRFGARGIEQFNEIVEKLSASQREEHDKINQKFAEEGKFIEKYYFNSLPYIVIVVEEFGDLMAVDKVNVEQAVVRLAQMARACGLHLILAMQSPRKDVVTGLIKTNIPGRISFKVASKMDSRIILDDSGAERLLAQGDMLYLAPGVSKPQRHHGAWVSEAEIAAVMKSWSDQGEPEYDRLAMRVLEGGGPSSQYQSASGGGALGTSGSSASGAADELELTASLGSTAGSNSMWGGTEEVRNFISGMNGDSEEEMDERYDEILAWVATQKEVSASLLQRRFRLGYPRAARMIELFEQEGVVGPASGAGRGRPVLVPSHAPEL